MTRRWILGLAAAVTAAATILAACERGSPARGRAPTTAELTPSVEAAFTHESYAPGATATLVISNRARGIRVQIFRSGPERDPDTERHDDERRSRLAERRSARARDGASCPFDRQLAERPLLRAPRARDGRVGFAPFVVAAAPARRARVAVVLPTLTWQAYNLRDEDGDGTGDSWYASWRKKTVRSAVPT